MALSIDELVSIVRTEIDDVAKPYLWADDEIIEYLDEGQEEFAVITEIFKANDSTIIVTAANSAVVLPEGIIRVRRARLALQKTPLRVSNFNEMDELVGNDDYGQITSNWEDSTGTPAFLVMDDLGGLNGTLVPQPTTTDTLTINYTRLPLKRLTASSQKTELVDRRHQRTLVIFAKAKAYNKHDADIYDPQMSSNLMEEFTSKAEEFRNEITRKTRKPGTVKYGGY